MGFYIDPCAGHGRVKPTIGRMSATEFFEFLTEAHRVSALRPPGGLHGGRGRAAGAAPAESQDQEPLSARQARRRHFLVCVPAAKHVNLRTLSDAIGSGRLSFGSPERLMAHLGVEPGAVTLLAAFNDPGGAVELFLDEDLWRTTVSVPSAGEHQHPGRHPRGRDALPRVPRPPLHRDPRPDAGRGDVNTQSKPWSGTSWPSTRGPPGHAS